MMLNIVSTSLPSCVKIWGGGKEDDCYYQAEEDGADKWVIANGKKM